MSLAFDTIGKSTFNLRNDYPVYQHYIDTFNKIPHRLFFENYSSNYDYDKIAVELEALCQKYPSTKIPNKFQCIDKTTSIIECTPIFEFKANELILCIDLTENTSTEDIIEFIEGTPKIICENIVILFSDTESDLLNELKEIFFKHKLTYKGETGFNIISRDQDGFGLEYLTFTKPEHTLELNYGKDFVKVHNSIVKGLKRKKAGLVVLSGLPGTGKSNYLKFLMAELNNSSFIVIPPKMAYVLSDPEFIPFLLENKNSILIIEDAEKALVDREDEPEYADLVSNILNLSDGLLGDGLNIKIITTQNKNVDRNDSALYRRGRLICEYKFDKLNIEDSNALAEELKLDVKFEEPQTVSDIYNYELELIRSSNTDEGIGF